MTKDHKPARKSVDVRRKIQELSGLLREETKTTSYFREFRVYRELLEGGETETD